MTKSDSKQYILYLNNEIVWYSNRLEWYVNNEQKVLCRSATISVVELQ